MPLGYGPSCRAFYVTGAPHRDSPEQQAQTARGFCCCPWLFGWDLGKERAWEALAVRVSSSSSTLSSSSEVLPEHYPPVDL